MPVPIIDLPYGVYIRPFIESHKGNPVMISSSIAPSDHTSYDQGFYVLHRFSLFVPFD
jgi:hypothetical protein